MRKALLLACLALSLPLSAEIHVVAFAGSTRENSYNKALVQEAAKIAHQEGAKFSVVDLSEYSMPLFNEDLERTEGMPSQARRLRQLMIDSDAIIIASPSYNGSVSALLKNAIDWASRDEHGGPSREAFQGKKFAIMSASPGPDGGARGLQHLRDIITLIGGEVISQQVSVHNAYNAFSEKGELKDPALHNALQQEVLELLRLAAPKEQENQSASA